MAAASDLDRVSMVVLRYMRRPIFVLILVYGVGITGMALIPGVAEDGQPQHMSLFHAFYFFTYTATTTGFGEIPNEFTDEQRLWTIFCLYMGVVAWLYAIGSIIKLIQNPHFIQALDEYRFARVVKRISDPFFIVCGFGDTGSLLARGLSDHWFGAVIIDPDPERIKALGLRNYHIKMPGLCGDPSTPRHLVNAGVQHPKCKAVIALTGDEDVNLKIAVVTRFMNPDVPVICRSTSPRHQEQLAAIENITVINPFEIFAQLLSMAMTSPRLHNLNSWLVGSKSVTLGKPLNVPCDNWILCGYGRMGQWFYKQMKLSGIDPLVIDPDIDESYGVGRYINAYSDHKALKDAGLADAAGILAGTDRDAHNLNILMSAQVLNPNVFTMVRQNHHINQMAFDAARVDLVLQPSLTTARRILKYLISPHIQSLLDYLHQKDHKETINLCDRLNKAIGDRTPHLWCITIRRKEDTAVTNFLQEGLKIKLGDIIRHPSARTKSLSCVPLSIHRETGGVILPKDEQTICENDKILFCGTKQSELLLAATLNNAYTLHYLITGEEMPRAYFFRWLAKLMTNKTAVSLNNSASKPNS
jgi:Trk K+ transport system NAD-binding subunit